MDLTLFLVSRLKCSLSALAVSTLVISVVFAMIPLCHRVMALAVAMAVAGLAMGIIDTIANLQLVKLYQKDSTIFLQVSRPSSDLLCSFVRVIFQLWSVRNPELEYSTCETFQSLLTKKVNDFKFLEDTVSDGSIVLLTTAGLGHHGNPLLFNVSHMQNNRCLSPQNFLSVSSN